MARNSSLTSWQHGTRQTQFPWEERCCLLDSRPLSSCARAAVCNTFVAARSTLLSIYRSAVLISRQRALFDCSSSCWKYSYHPDRIRNVLELPEELSSMVVDYFFDEYMCKEKRS